MAGYTDLDSIHRASTGAVAPAAWGASVNDDIAFLATFASDAVVASQTTTSVSYTDLGTVGPTVTVETGTAVIVTLSCVMLNSSAGEATCMAVEISGAYSLGAADLFAFSWENPAASKSLRAGIPIPIGGLTPGVNTFRAKYRVSGGTGTFAERRLTVQLLG